VIDENGEEKIVFGLGIAYNHKKGDEIDQKLIDKVFIADCDQEASRLTEMIKNIPEQHMGLAEEIIDYAASILKKEFTPSLYVALADHIHFTEQRAKENMIIRNPLKWEIAQFYPDEYKIGKKAVELLNDELDLKLPDDEAVSIAMHMINADISSDLSKGMEMVEMVNSLMQIIKYQVNINFDENSLHYQRLVTHLKFFVMRVIKNEQHQDEMTFFKAIQENYPKAYACVLRLKEFVEKKYSYEVSYDEMCYLTIHIQRMLTAGK
jgi:beta-glucoside operon transcriptional antiterminator